ncbi:hypothetical protein HK414_19470 [Ramlibacter terrae]|uniref:Aminotransferase class V-fold PLP-dependent enzyme n=1 Tax=Ramlibacter terrae TaxID=2732511 RepID=A0ABX6P4I4_9BURK|nr:hypothetical protein HK414_19470 [Ramlibacter terrae]
MPLTLNDCLERDADDGALRGVRERFAPGDAGTLYFDANSIGPMPLDAPARMQAIPRRAGPARAGAAGTSSTGCSSPPCSAPPSRRSSGRRPATSAWPTAPASTCTSCFATRWRPTRRGA